MNKIRMNQAEAAQIQEVADRLARRTSERFVLDTDRIEIVEENHETNSTADASGGPRNHVNVG